MGLHFGVFKFSSNHNNNDLSGVYIHESDSAENFTVVASGAVTAAFTGGHPGADLSVPRYIQYTTIVSSAVLF